MALPQLGYIDVRVGGNDANGGGFSPGSLTFTLTDLAVTGSSGLTTTPTVSSATYTFQAGDVGYRLYIGAGTGWLIGWYKITAVNAGVATLSAPANSAPNYASSAGVGGASLTGGSFTIDRSMSNTATINIDNSTVTTSITANVVTLTGYTVNGTEVGNAIQFTSGTNITLTGLYVVTAASIGGNTLTVAGAAALPTSGTTTNAVGKMGGAFVSPAIGTKFISNITAWQVHIQSNGTSADYSVTSASTNVSNGCMSTALNGSGSAGANRIIGYQTEHWDYGTAPTIQASGGISTFNLFSSGAGTVAIGLHNVVLDCNSLTSGVGATGQALSCYKVTVKNATSAGFGGGQGCSYISCLASSCNAGFLFSAFAAQAAAHFEDCVALSCTNGFGIGPGSNSVRSVSFFRCFAINCTNDGFRGSNSGITIQMVTLRSCVAYGNGNQGFNCSQMGEGDNIRWIDCLSVNNTKFGFSSGGGATGGSVMLINCAAYGNGSGPIDTISLSPTAGSFDPRLITNFITLTANPFNNAAGNDFSLNTAPGGGASLRAAGYPSSFPGLSTNNYADIGAAQHQDSAPTAAAVATAVWTDLLASSDFSTASSIGALLKLAIPGVAPGANGGLPTADASNQVKSNVTAWAGDAAGIAVDANHLPKVDLEDFRGILQTSGAIPTAVAGASGGLFISGANTGPVSVSNGVTFTGTTFGSALSLQGNVSTGTALDITGNTGIFSHANTPAWFHCTATNGSGLIIDKAGTGHDILLNGDGSIWDGANGHVVSANVSAWAGDGAGIAVDGSHLPEVSGAALGNVTVGTNLDKTGYALSSAGLDSVLVESGITPSAALVDDNGTQLTSINMRQAMALVLSSPTAGLLSGITPGAAGTWNITGIGVGAGQGKTRVQVSGDGRGNRTGVNLKVPV